MGPNSPAARRDQRACGMSLLPASIFRSIKSRIKIPEFPALGLGREKKKKVVMRLKITGHLNPNHCSGLGNRASTPRWKEFWRGNISVLQPQSSGWKGGEQGNRVSIIIFIFYFWNLAVPGSREEII